ncbi:MAG TPA: hypothetical protein VFD50_11165, partial [Thermoleophilia bacterium]|nr:hypothetical protein [Thermoleophilia bacterium]
SPRRRFSPPRRRIALPRHMAGAARLAPLAACLVIVAAILGACSSPATSSSVSALAAKASAGASGSPAAQGKAAAGVNDWTHVLQVLAKLKAAPNDPVVVLLGGSAARESTIKDAGAGSWAAQVAADGGPAIPTYNLGSRNRTLAQDVQIVQYLPKGSLVFVGINIGRFTEPKSSPKIVLPTSPSVDPGYVQHQYGVSNRLSDAKKKLMLQQWLAKRYPEFKKHFKLNEQLLTTLVGTCKKQGLHVVLLDLPRNTDIIGKALNKPVSRMTAACKSVAAENVPWVSFVAKAHVPNASFYDLWHLVQPGRVTWQTLLSAKTAELLNSYPGA